MKCLAFIFIVLMCSCSSSDQTTPQDLFTKAHNAVIQGDIESLQECITHDDSDDAVMNKAFAELIIYVKSGTFQSMREKYETRLKETENYATSQVMFQAFGVNYMPDFDKAAAIGVHDEATGIFSVESEGQPLKYKLTEKEGVYTFGMEVGKHDPKIVEGMNFLRGLEPALALPSAAETTQAINKLIQQHIKPTDLEFAKGNLAGKMSGNDWSLVAGRAQQSTRDGDSRITLTLNDAKAPSDCRRFFEGSKVYLTFDKPGTYDFGQTGVNLTLAYSPENSNKLVDDGKIEVAIEGQMVKGRITAKRDDDNYVSGSFEVPICGSIELE